MLPEVEKTVAALVEALPSPSSRTAYNVVWKRFLKWLDREKLDALAVKPRHFDEHAAFLLSEGKAKATISHAFSVLREIYGALVRNELLPTNPAREIKMRRVPSDPKTPWLTEDEARALMNVRADTWKERRAKLTTTLMLALGWRRAEIARLCVEDFQDGTVKGVAKGSKKFVVAVPEWLLKEIAEWMSFAGIEEGALLPRSEEDPRPISGRMAYLDVKATAKVANLPSEKVTPHGLRRTKITLSIHEDVPIEELQNSVGHSSRATTERYLKAAKATKNPTGAWMERLIDKKEPK